MTYIVRSSLMHASETSITLRQWHRDTCILLKAKLDGKLLVEGKTWTGFANSEEQFADDFVGKRIQPFRIEEEAKKIAGTNFIVASRFKPHAVRDGNLITGQQQYSGTEVAKLVVEALGV